MNRLARLVLRPGSPRRQGGGLHLRQRLLGELRRSLPRRRYITTSAAAFGVFVLAWSLATYSGLLDPFFLPKPSAVVGKLVHLVVQENFLIDVRASVLRICGGFALAALAAIPLGILAGSYPKVDALISPFSAFLRYMPATAFVPLLILWFGIGDAEKMAVIFLGTFFYVLVLITDAAAAVEMSLLETSYTLGATQWQTLRRVVLPAMAPDIVNSLKAMIGAAWTYLIVAELVAADKGMGRVIAKAGDWLKTDTVMAGIMAVGIIGIVTNVAFELISFTAFPWRRAHKAAES